MVQVFRIFNPGRSDHFESKSSQNLSKEVEKGRLKERNVLANRQESQSIVIFMKGILLGIKLSGNNQRQERP